MNRTIVEKLRLFAERFKGLDNVYGSYSLRTGRAFQVKKPVTDRVLYDHLAGRQPFGVYLLVKDRTSSVVVDFDDPDRNLPLMFVSRARHYGIEAYIEVSKAKGFHVWAFLRAAVLSWKVRRVFRHILEEIDAPHTEIFPKQDSIDLVNQWGNFINAPLFGKLVPNKKTVFVDGSFEPYEDQWDFLEGVSMVDEEQLDEIIELNDLQPTIEGVPSRVGGSRDFYSLPHCARQMLEGVEENQRVSCFRLAVHLKRLGLNFDASVAVLRVWAQKNRPSNGKQVITDREIISQAESAYRGSYRGYGCDSEAVRHYCSADCPVQGTRFTQVSLINNPGNAGKEKEKDMFKLDGIDETKEFGNVSEGEHKAVIYRAAFWDGISKRTGKPYEKLNVDFEVLDEGQDIIVGGTFFVNRYSSEPSRELREMLIAARMITGDYSGEGGKTRFVNDLKGRQLIIDVEDERFFNKGGVEIRSKAVGYRALPEEEYTESYPAGGEDYGGDPVEDDLPF